MANIRDFFSGDYLKAENCKGGERVKILKAGVIEEIKSPEGEIKTVLNYRVLVDGKEKDFTPNKTNGNIMIEAWGEDDDNWINKEFIIELVKVSVFGKMKNSIIVKPIVEKAEAKKVKSTAELKAELAKREAEEKAAESVENDADLDY